MATHRIKKLMQLLLLQKVLNGKGSEEKVMDQIFQLKLTSKPLVRQAKQCELDEKAEKAKIKKAIERENTDGARIHAHIAIRKETEQLNYLCFASRLDLVASRLCSQIKLQVPSKTNGDLCSPAPSAIKNQWRALLSHLRGVVSRKHAKNF
ncbi:hypothetical protein AMTR_s00017p00228920 [Amborella trichopoda]|uniref:Uncharacterized protein n=1 Tax=Amborella trichopoda TaxID=13333 RepID=W1PFF2_AMBTC|nr:hypothetical protein AMTR_s00017p00228920 [Amborella trichopoda]